MEKAVNPFLSKTKPGIVNNQINGVQNHQNLSSYNGKIFLASNGQFKL